MERSASLTQATIVREKENDIMAKPRQFKRQRAGDIGKPTGLRIRDRFRGDHEQVQRMLGHGEPRRSFDITSPDEERGVARCKGGGMEILEICSPEYIETFFMPRTRK